MANANQNKKPTGLIIIAALLILALLAVCALAFIGFLAFNILVG